MKWWQEDPDVKVGDIVKIRDHQQLKTYPFDGFGIIIHKEPNVFTKRTRDVILHFARFKVLWYDGAVTLEPETALEIISEL